MLPDYIAKTVPNPSNKRGPWYANTAPSYAGIFLWIAFYRSMAGGTLAHGSLAVCFAGLIAAGLLCHFLYYLAPAMLGMKTGLPLYVVGSSTFGTKGGYVMPGLLMGLLQIGWFAVATSVASEFILRGRAPMRRPGTRRSLSLA
jgi:cytosine permease